MSLNLGLFSLNPKSFAFLLAILALNILVLWVLRRVSIGIRLSDIVTEKDPSIINARANLLKSQLAYLQGLKSLGLTITDPGPIEPPKTDPNSFSRLAGVLGSIVMVATLWGLGNFAVWASFWNPNAVETVLKSAGTYFLSGSALFAPYAFNQHGTIFRSPNPQQS